MKAGIIAFAFGTPSSIKANKVISKIAYKRALKHNVSIYTQLEIEIEEGVEVDRIKGREVPTLRIAREAVQWAKEKGIEKFFIVSASPHLWRCVRDVNMAIREIKAKINVEVCEEIRDYSDSMWFCLNSTQERTRTLKSWNEREWILKKIPFFVYKILAS